MKVEEEKGTSKCEDVCKIRLNINAVSNGRQLKQQAHKFFSDEKFPNISGLQLTLLQNEFKLHAFFAQTFLALYTPQILHVHWIKNSNLQCEVGKF